MRSEFVMEQDKMTFHTQEMRLIFNIFFNSLKKHFRDFKENNDETFWLYVVLSPCQKLDARFNLKRFRSHFHQQLLTGKCVTDKYKVEVLFLLYFMFCLVLQILQIYQDISYFGRLKTTIGIAE